MRVISGRLGGRTFNSPHGHRTHPMSEKIRGAIFNSLGDVSELTVLDAYSGSGALAIEAVSRGAKHAVAIDLDTSAHRAISENIQSLGIDYQVDSVRAAIRSWSRRHQKQTFDIVFLDPPYDSIEPKVMQSTSDVHSKVGGIVVISLPPTSGFKLTDTNYKLLSSKSYGDADIFIYRRTS